MFPSFFGHALLDSLTTMDAMIPGNFVEQEFSVTGSRPLLFTYRIEISAEWSYLSKVGQISPKWDKSATFSDQIVAPVTTLLRAQ